MADKKEYKDRQKVVDKLVPIWKEFRVEWMKSKEDIDSLGNVGIKKMLTGELGNDPCMKMLKKVVNDIRLVCPEALDA